MIVIFFIVLSVVLIDGLLGWMLYQQHQEEERVKQWPSVSGTVLKSEVEIHVIEHKEERRPVIKYSYEIEGKEYKHSNFAPGYVSSVNVENLIVPYPVGTRLNVFYNPQNPKEAILEKQSKSMKVLWITLVVTTIVMCCGVPLYIWYLSK